MEDLKKSLEEITKKYAECVDRMLDAELNKESLTAEDVGVIGSSFSLLNHVVATIERISRLQKVKDEESDGLGRQGTIHKTEGHGKVSGCHPADCEAF